MKLKWVAKILRKICINFKKGEVRERYIIFKGSASCHCCFEYTIFDTDHPVMFGGKHYCKDGIYHYKNVAESFELENAEKICRSLNETQP